MDFKCCRSSRWSHSWRRRRRLRLRKSEMPGVRNYSRVDATVGCGGAGGSVRDVGLKKEGYVSVSISGWPTKPGADIDAGRAAAQSAGLKYIHLPFNAAAPDPKVVSDFLGAVADKSNQPVFVHCGSANRVGAVWMISGCCRTGGPWIGRKPRQKPSVCRTRSSSRSRTPTSRNTRRSRRDND